jgi:hypothetical protein
MTRQCYQEHLQIVKYLIERGGDNFMVLVTDSVDLV